MEDCTTKEGSSFFCWLCYCSCLLYSCFRDGNPRGWWPRHHQIPAKIHSPCWNVTPHGGAVITNEGRSTWLKVASLRKWCRLRWIWGVLCGWGLPILRGGDREVQEDIPQIECG